MKHLCTIVLSLFLCNASAQFSISDDITSSFAESQDGESYFKPLGKVYSSLLHSGIFPRYSEKGFHIKLGLHVTRLSIYSDYMDFEAESTGIEVPNIAGKEETVIFDEDGSNERVYPAGNNVGEVILGAPELYVGTLLGTDFYGRYGFLSLTGNLGDLTFYGGGIRHDFGRYFLPEYVKWYLSYSYHQMKIGNNINSINQYGLTQLGVKLNRIGFYGLFGMEFNDATLTYDFPNNGSSTQSTIALVDDFPFRYGGGFNLSFKYVEFYGEYNMNDPIALLVGFSFGI